MLAKCGTPALLYVALVPFFAFREIAQTVGEAEFRTLMFGPAKRAVEGIDHLSCPHFRPMLLVDGQCEAARKVAAFKDT
jgi:hypothetical protein